MDVKNIAKKILDVVKQNDEQFSKSELANYIVSSMQININSTVFFKSIIKIIDVLIKKEKLKLSSNNKLIYQEKFVAITNEYNSTDYKNAENDYIQNRLPIENEEFYEEELDDNEIINMDFSPIKMNSLTSSLNKLANTTFEIGEQTRYRVEHPLDAYIHKIHEFNFSTKIITKIVNYIKTGFDSNVISIPKNLNEVVEGILNKIVQSMKEHNVFPSLTTRECRYLLFYDDIVIDMKYSNFKTNFINYLNTQEKITTLLFRAVLITYFKHYTTLSNNDEFYNMFKNAYYKYFNTSRFIPKSLDNLNSNTNLLSKNLCLDLAEYCVSLKKESNLSINDIITQNFKLIVPTMDIYDELYKQIGLVCLNNIRDSFYLETLIDDVLLSNIQKNKMDEFVSRLLSIFSHNIDSNIQNKIQISLLKNPNYGDPRTNSLNWMNVEEKAKRIFITWLAKEDLEFFFDVIFHESRDIHGRKKFWEQYINSQNLQYSKVILSSYASSLEPIKNAEREGKRFAKFRYSIDKTSCFILAFDSAYIVEFSEYANSMYFFRKDASLISMDKMSYPSVSALKPTNTPQYSIHNEEYFDLDEIERFRMTHNDGWQERTKKYLSRNLRIYPE